MKKDMHQKSKCERILKRMAYGGLAIDIVASVFVILILFLAGFFKSDYMLVAVLFAFVLGLGFLFKYLCGIVVEKVWHGWIQ